MRNYPNGLPDDALWVIRYGNREEDHSLKENIDRYVDLIGWSRKRFLLIAVAEYIKKQGDNPELVMQIAEHLMSKRRHK